MKVKIITTIFITMLFVNYVFAIENNEKSDICPKGDINDDCIIGFQEAINALKIIADLPVNYDNQKLSEINDIANLSIKAISDQQNGVNSLQKLTSVLSFVNLDIFDQNINKNNSLDIQKITLKYPCGKIIFGEGQTLALVFDGASTCSGITGTVSFTIDILEKNINIKFQNVIIDNCKIDGEVNASLIIQNGNISIELSIINLTICDEYIDGVYSISYSPDNGIIFNLKHSSLNTYTINGNNADILVDISYSHADGLTGTSQITYNEKVYNIEFINVKIDNYCKIPVSGEIIINDIIMDLTKISCSDNVLELIIDNIPVNLNIDSIKIKKQLQTTHKDQENSVKSDNIELPDFSEAINDFESILDNVEKQGGLASIVKVFVENAEFPCGKIVVNNFYPFDGTFIFNGDSRCFGIVGSVNLKSYIFDTKANITFYDLIYKNCIIKGEAIASITTENCGYKAVATSKSLDVCGHKLLGNLTAENNNNTNGELLLGINGTDNFKNDSTVLNLIGDLLYTHKGGVNGTGIIILNGTKINCEFNNFVIDLQKLMPVSGSLSINGKNISF